MVSGFLSVGQFAKCQLNQGGTEGTEKKLESLAAARRLTEVRTPVPHRTPPLSPFPLALLSLYLREVTLAPTLASSARHPCRVVSYGS